MLKAQSVLLTSLGVSYETKRTMELVDWDCYSLNHNSKSGDAPILLVESGPKNMAEVKKEAKKFDTCVMIITNLKKLYIKTLEKTYTTSLDSDVEYERIAKILEANNVGTAGSYFELNAYLEHAIEAIPTTVSDFENRGLFSTHYLNGRLFDDTAPPNRKSSLRYE